MDLLEGLAPWFHEVVNVAPRQLDVLRARYVVSDVLAPLGQDPRVVGVLDNQGRHPNCRKHRPNIHLSHQRQHESNGPWAHRQPLMPGPRCPDLLVPRHVRIVRMLELPGPPHRDHGSPRFFRIEPISAFLNRIRVTLKDDQRGGARRICRREQRSRRDRANARDEDRFAAPEVVQHGGDAVGPLLQRRQRARRHRIGRSRARLVEEDEPTERCHRLDPPLSGR